MITDADIFLNSRVVLTDGRPGVVYMVDKIDGDIETWDYYVDVDGLSVVTNVIGISEVTGGLEETDEEFHRNMAELRLILTRQWEQTEAKIAKEKHRLERIEKIQWLVDEKWFN